jgi:hypothetical protein
LAVAGSIEEVFAETFEAIGVAVAFWSFSAKGKGLGLCGYERQEYELEN